jgi:DNA polymerase-3 subunit gamma/tau
MSYRVFARKYRPQRFQEVVGQRSIIQTLQNAIRAQQLAQAYLFVGPRGIGKTSIARIFAKALNCHEGVTIDPCGRCPACLEIAEGHSMDVLEIDGASNNSVESIRTLRENAAFAPTRGPYKIYLIDEVHMLTTAAFNALLKTLEEPPEHVKFIFATTEAQKLPATITSRCQRFDLSRLTEKEIADHLLWIAQQEEITLLPEAAMAVAHGADGALRDAESMLDQLVAFCGKRISERDVQHIFGFTPSDLVHQLGKAILTFDIHAALTLIQEQSEGGKDLSRLLSDLIHFFRDLLIETVHPSSEQTRFSILRDHVTSEKLLNLLEELGKAEERFKWATNKRLQFDVLAIKAIHLLQEVSLTDVLHVLTTIQEGKELPKVASRPLKLPADAKATYSSEAKISLAAPTRPAAIASPSPQQAPAAEIPGLENTAPLLKEEEQVSSFPEAAAASVALETCEGDVDVIRLLGKRTDADEVQGASSEQTRRVHEVLEDAIPASAGRTFEMTQQFAAAVEFCEKSIETTPCDKDPWNTIATSLASESPLKFGWLTTGRFVEQKNHQIVVEFPPSYEVQTETLFWPQARKKIQECLTQNLGEKIELVTRFNGEEVPEESFHEEIMEFTPSEEIPTKNPPPLMKVKPSPAPKTNTIPTLTSEELEHFKNDPLIKKALEIFEAEIIC